MAGMMPVLRAKMQILIITDGVVSKSELLLNDLVVSIEKHMYY